MKTTFLKNLIALVLVASLICPSSLLSYNTQVKAEGLTCSEDFNIVELPVNDEIQKFLQNRGLNPDDYRVYVPENDMQGLLNSFGDDVEFYAEPSGIITTIVVIIGGVVVGYIIDGVVIAETGKSASQWAAEAYIWVKGGINSVVTKLYGQFRTNGRAVITHGTDESGECVQRFPGGPILCIN